MKAIEYFGVVMILAILASCDLYNDPFDPEIRNLKQPVIYPEGGNYKGSQVVTLQVDTLKQWDAIYYTLDGSEPDTSSNKYFYPFVIRSSATVKAVVVSRNELNTVEIIRSLTSSSAYTISQDSFVDQRDGKSYAYVTLGTQKWMAQNLNYNSNKYWESQSVLDKGIPYGRWYNWALAMNLSESCNTKSCAYIPTRYHQGICPDGWRLPNDSDWIELERYVESTGTVLGNALSDIELDRSQSVKDNYGFHALYPPADGRTSMDSYGYWTNVSETVDRAKYWVEGKAKALPSTQKENWRSVRCIQGEAVAPIYQFAVATPEFSKGNSQYSRPFYVKIFSNTAGSEIYYTTDGTDPNELSQKFEDSLFVDTTQILRAIAIKDGLKSEVNVGSFMIIPWQSSVSYDTLLHKGIKYRTVEIGNQTWMAENFQFAGVNDDLGQCYGNREDSCLQYGRLYTWSEVMNGQDSIADSSQTIQGICPEGWFVPRDRDWETLRSYVDAHSDLATEPLSTMNKYPSQDLFGFRALGGGYAFGKKLFDSEIDYWWSASSTDSTHARFRFRGNIQSGTTKKEMGFALRCFHN